MSILITKPGILTTIQDLGRPGAQRFGLNPGGVMDRATVRFLNILLGNDETAAVLEMHFPACAIEFEVDALIAVGGADFSPHVEGRPVPNGTTVFIPKGGSLTFAKPITGQRAYLAVREGLHVQEWRGSRSTNFVASVGGLDGRKLAAGDRIECSASVDTKHLSLGTSLQPRHDGPVVIRVVAGNEHEFLTALSERDLLNEIFTLTSDCDRMGYRLEGKRLHLLHPREMVSSAVTFGTVQLLPDGQQVVLMADHQTAGGYPRIASVVSADLPLLAQCGPGDRLRFEMVSIKEAEQLSMKFERILNFLRVGCRLQGQNANY